MNFDKELLIKGPSLMSGYFSKGKIRSVFDEEGWYHTGDKVSLGEYGELYYHGRIDRQLKCHGFRVEPEEVEKAFFTYPNINECVVIGIEHKSKVSLVACIGRAKADLLSFSRDIYFFISFQKKLHTSKLKL